MELPCTVPYWAGSYFHLFLALPCAKNSQTAAKCCLYIASVNFYTISWIIPVCVVCVLFLNSFLQSIIHINLAVNPSLLYQDFAHMNLNIPYVRWPPSVSGHPLFKPNLLSRATYLSLESSRLFFCQIFPKKCIICLEADFLINGCQEADCNCNSLCVCFFFDIFALFY